MACDVATLIEGLAQPVEAEAEAGAMKAAAAMRLEMRDLRIMTTFPNLGVLTHYQHRAAET